MRHRDRAESGFEHGWVCSNEFEHNDNRKAGRAEDEQHVDNKSIAWPVEQQHCSVQSRHGAVQQQHDNPTQRWNEDDDQE